MPDETRHENVRPPMPQEVREHLHAARAEMRRGLETFMPPAFFDHRDNARREMLLAWRGSIDAALKRMDDKAPKA